MKTKLSKRPGTDADQGMYEIAGSMEGLTGPGRRRVLELELRDLDGDDLSVLETFEELESLRIERSRNIDLRSLPARPGLLLILDKLPGLRLEALDGRDDLSGLWLIDLHDCQIPERLRLSSELRELVVLCDAPRPHGKWVQELIAAIDWRRIDELESLSFDVKLGQSIGVNLGFLAHLPSLERLELLGDLRHAGPQPSPLAPPFAGLPRKLTQLRVEAHDADQLKIELQRYLDVPIDPSAELPSVIKRYGWEPGVPMWQISESGLGWEAFGSFSASFAQAGFSEARARAEAARRLRKADKPLATRLALDSLKPGSALLAQSRDDLQAALAILELTPGMEGSSTPSTALMFETGDGDEPRAQEWKIIESELGGWSVYGSLYELFDGQAGDGEYEAMREAQKRIRHHDRALERRLDFDHESDGTGIYARTRDDLERSLAILGIEP